MTTPTPTQGREALFLTQDRNGPPDSTPPARRTPLIPQQCQGCGKCTPDESFAAMGDEARQEMLERGYGG